jgi:hypothetical protein
MVNTFPGSHQWLMSLMASALLGNKSIVSLELFCYIFPHANVSFNDSLLPSKTDLSDDTSHSISFDKNSNEYTQSCPDAVMVAVSKNEDHNKSCGGTTLYKTDYDTVVFLTQAELYYHHLPAFTNYLQLEFECIVQLQPK